MAESYVYVIFASIYWNLYVVILPLEYPGVYTLLINNNSNSQL